MSTMGRLADVDQFANMILKTDALGRIVRLSDVANIELGAQAYDQTCTLNGTPCCNSSDTCKGTFPNTTCQ